MSDLVIVDFYADWCGPCKMMNPIIERMKKSYPEIEIQKINIDNEDVTEFDIKAVPTFVFKKNNVEAFRGVGAIPIGKFERMIEQLKESV